VLGYAAGCSSTLFGSSRLGGFLMRCGFSDFWRRTLRWTTFFIKKFSFEDASLGFGAAAQQRYIVPFFLKARRTNSGRITSFPEPFRDRADQQRYLLKAFGREVRNGVKNIGKAQWFAGLVLQTLSPAKSNFLGEYVMRNLEAGFRQRMFVHFRWQ
jgi:hypothetical protein